ncbi:MULTISPECIES: TonB-dependent receptor [Microvirgula]|uniref:TonB-dependent receptor n=1 Tax=Microvirgula TaxID=57479 RepID=UPI0004917A11|nr:MULTISPECIES: TonB-dependent receptor [Microvirgula]RAS15752.1 iron complex outermembrane receptor protein [Microvirgula sp. AG722]
MPIYSHYVRLCPVSAALLLALGSPCVQAGGSALDTVVVTGARVPTRISELPRSTWVVDADEIALQARAGVPLKVLLGQLVPSLDVGPQGRSNYGQNLRGRSMQVMIDGVSLNSSRAVSRQFDSIDPYQIDRIEVLSGATALYGGGASGGVVNIVTRRGSEGLHFNTELGLRSGFETGSDHDWRAGQSVSAGNDRVTGRLGVAYRHNGAAYDAAGRQVTPDITQTDLQYNRQLDILGNLDFRLPAGQRLKLTTQYYDSGFHGDKALYLGPNLAGALRGRTEWLAVRDGFQSDVVPRSTRAMAMFDYVLPQVPGGQDLYLQGSWRSEKLDFYPFPGVITGMTVRPPRVPYYSTSRQRTGTRALKVALVKSLGAARFTYGIDLDREKFRARQVLFDARRGMASGGLVFRRMAEVGRYPGFRVEGRSLFIQSDWQPAESWGLSAGLRHQRMAISVDDFVDTRQQVLMANRIGTSSDAIPGGRNHYAVTLPNAGVVYRFNAANQYYVNYAEGFELPDPAKYYGQGDYALSGGHRGHWALKRGVSVTGSPLAGIKTRQLEAGWRGRVGKLSGQIAAFHAWSDRSIEFQKSTLAIRVLDQGTRNHGLEGRLDYLLNAHWTVGGTALGIQSREQQGGRWQKQSVTTASPSKTTLHVHWQDGPLQLRLQGVRSFPLRDAGRQTLEGFTLADLLGSYKLPRGTLNFGVQNLFDRQYPTLWSQRARLFYDRMVAPEVVDFQGRGRTFSLAYGIDY